jgi:serine/threonine protein kinase
MQDGILTNKSHVSRIRQSNKISYNKNDQGSVAIKSSADKIIEEEEHKYEEGDRSAHMVARWYRPPEIILGSQNYDFKVDIWSLGCIFAELMYTWLPGYHDPESRTLFQGGSCYPLSPS